MICFALVNCWLRGEASPSSCALALHRLQGIEKVLILGTITIRSRCLPVSGRADVVSSFARALLQGPVCVGSAFLGAVDELEQNGLRSQSTPAIHETVESVASAELRGGRAA